MNSRQQVARRTYDQAPPREQNGGRIVGRSMALQRYRQTQSRNEPIDAFCVSLTAPAAQVQRFDDAVTDLHDSVAVGNHEIFGDPLPAHLPGGALQLRARMATRARTDDPHAVAAEGMRGAGGALPHLQKIQAAFGHHDLSDVLAYTGAGARKANEKLGAHAYASGNGIAFASAPDLHTAAHEAAHIVQQRAGVSLPGGVGSAGDRHEQHADRVADLVVRGESAAALLDSYGGGRGGGGGAVQRSVQLKEDEGAPEPPPPTVAEIEAVIAKVQGGKSSAEVSSCNVTCETLATKIFEASEGKLRPDKVFLNNEHYVLRFGNIIVDPTALQNVNFPKGEEPPVLVGKPREIKAKIAKYADEYGIRREGKQEGMGQVPAHITNGRELGEEMYSDEGVVVKKGKDLKKVTSPSGKDSWIWPEGDLTPAQLRAIEVKKEQERLLALDKEREQANNQKPAAQQPTPGEEAPPGSKPPATEEAPPSAAKRPAANDNDAPPSSKPPATDEVPPSAAKRPAANDNDEPPSSKPPATEEVPPSVAKRPAANDNDAPPPSKPPAPAPTPAHADEGKKPASSAPPPAPAKPSSKPPAKPAAKSPAPAPVATDSGDDTPSPPPTPKAAPSQTEPAPKTDSGEAPKASSPPPSDDKNWKAHGPKTPAVTKSGSLVKNPNSATDDSKKPKSPNTTAEIDLSDLSKGKVKVSGNHELAKIGVMVPIVGVAGGAGAGAGGGIGIWAEGSLSAGIGVDASVDLKPGEQTWTTEVSASLKASATVAVVGGIKAEAGPVKAEATVNASATLSAEVKATVGVEMQGDSFKRILGLTSGVSASVAGTLALTAKLQAGVGPISAGQSWPLASASLPLLIANFPIEGKPTYGPSKEVKELGAKAAAAASDVKNKITQALKDAVIGEDPMEKMAAEAAADEAAYEAAKGDWTAEKKAMGLDAATWDAMTSEEQSAFVDCGNKYKSLAADSSGTKTEQELLEQYAGNAREIVKGVKARVARQAAEQKKSQQKAEYEVNAELVQFRKAQSGLKAGWTAFEKAWGNLNFAVNKAVERGVSPQKYGPISEPERIAYNQTLKKKEGIMYKANGLMGAPTVTGKPLGADDVNAASAELGTQTASIVAATGKIRAL